MLESFPKTPISPFHRAMGIFAGRHIQNGEVKIEKYTKKSSNLMIKMLFFVRKTEKEINTSDVLTEKNGKYIIKSQRHMTSYVLFSFIER